MTKQFWLNLPVKNVTKSTEFFRALGFKFNEARTNDQSACMLLGENSVVVMLFNENTFKGFTGNAVADASKANEALMSIDAESVAEVDELAAKAIAAGGHSNHRPYDIKDGWMYGCIFTDPDGHKWNVLYMDMSKMPG